MASYAAYLLKSLAIPGLSTLKLGPAHKNDAVIISGLLQIIYMRLELSGGHIVRR